MHFIIIKITNIINIVKLKQVFQTVCMWGTQEETHTFTIVISFNYSQSQGKALVTYHKPTKHIHTLNALFY